MRKIITLRVFTGVTYISDIFISNEACVYFPIYKGFPRKLLGQIRAVDRINLSIKTSDSFGLVGESGSGKTTFAKAIVGINELTSGKILFQDTDITDISKNERRKYMQKIQYLYQDPSSSLDPRKSVKNILMEPLSIQKMYKPEERLKVCEEALDAVDLPHKDFLNRYPANLSGGQKQRVAIARTLILRPDLIILDEPTSALDVSVQAKILELLNQVKDEFKLTYLIITHDLSVISNVTNRMSVLYLGQIMEEGNTKDIFKNPKHPYTQLLLVSIPTVTDSEEVYKPKDVQRIEGEIPSFLHVPEGCRFSTRCPHVMDICRTKKPGSTEVGPDHNVFCHLFGEGKES